MKRIILATIMLVAFIFNSKADVFQSGDLYYNITNNEEPYTVEVTYEKTSSPRYSNLPSEVSIPSSVTYDNKTYSVTSIGNNAFYDCSSLNSIDIPNTVTSIGNNAFLYCGGLTSVTIPNSVTNIGKNAFDNCSGLTSVDIPKSVTSIGSNAFSGCKKLTSINVAIDNSNFSSVNGVLFNKSMTTLVCYPAGKIGSYTIPNSVTNIGDGAFSNCRRY